MSTVLRIGQWDRARRMIAGAAGKLERAVQRSLRSEAERVRDAIREGLERQAPGGRALRPLAPSTLAARALVRQRSTRALIERGELQRALVDVVRPDSAFVGIRRRSRGRDGRPLAAIAQLHELGGTVRVRMTPSMRRFLFAMARASASQPTRSRTGRSAGAIVIQIPARAFLRPAFEVAVRDARSRWLRGVGRALGWRA